MQSGLRVNAHGVVAILIILLMVGIALYLQWQIDWVYCAITVSLYTSCVIGLSFFETDSDQADTNRMLIGLHLAFFLLVIELPIFPQFGWSLAISSAIFGMVIPYALLRAEHDTLSLNTHGLIMLILLGCGAAAAWFLDRSGSQDVPRYTGYFYGAVLLTLAYIWTTVRLNMKYPSGISPP